MAKIRKALIPAAGYGTRFLPQTKAMPKEMMPLVDKPIIQRVVEELVDAGIETIVIVSGWNKRSIEDHFDNNFELETKLEQAGKTAALETVRKISDLAEFVYIRQKGPQGNATPILNAKHIMGSEPFMVFWGDDFIDATPSRAKQLAEAFEKYNASVVGGIKAKDEKDYEKYAFFSGDQVEDGIYKVSKIIEKPGSSSPDLHDLAIVSGFVATKDIYGALEQIRPSLSEGQELVYTLGLQEMIDQDQEVYAVELKDAIYRDTGNKLEYLKTVVEYGLKHPEINGAFKEFLKKISE